jgi:RimJ/RimL family protein N-acetyltransferase
MPFIEPTTLVGQHVRLEPLGLEHAADLCEAAQDGELWRLWYCSVPHPENIETYIALALSGQKNQGDLPFAVRSLDPRGTGKIIGSTRFLRVDPENRRLEIGFTWYAQRFQRTAANTETKLLLLQHAFEFLQCIAVEFRTHWMNHRSREAISRLGAKQDGVLRNHAMMSGVRRDTVVFSIIDSEWPTVKLHLRHKLASCVEDTELHRAVPTRQQ